MIKADAPAAGERDDIKTVVFIQESSRAQLTELARLVDEGHLRPQVGPVYPLAEAARGVPREGRGRNPRPGHPPALTAANSAYPRRVSDVMRALIIDGPRSARVGEVEVPRPAPGQVVVDVHRVGICGTDVELFTGELAYFEQGKSRFPLRPGHEWCGVVSAVGAAVDEAWLGVRVTGDTMLGCGRCRRCRAGNGHVCADRHEIGITAWPGALADQVLAPVTSLHRLPAAVDDRAGALVEPGGNAQRAVAAAQAGPGRRILVCGPGTIGLLAVAFASAAGAEVDVLAVDASRRELAATFGASGYWAAGRPAAGPV